MRSVRVVAFDVGTARLGIASIVANVKPLGGRLGTRSHGKPGMFGSCLPFEIKRSIRTLFVDALGAPSLQESKRAVSASNMSSAMLRLFRNSSVLLAAVRRADFVLIEHQPARLQQDAACCLKTVVDLIRSGDLLADASNEHVVRSKGVHFVRPSLKCWMNPEVPRPKRSDRKRFGRRGAGSTAERRKILKAAALKDATSVIAAAANGSEWMNVWFSKIPLTMGRRDASDALLHAIKFVEYCGSDAMGSAGCVSNVTFCPLSHVPK